MRYLYTTPDKADDGCHEICEGVVGRPVHYNERKKLLAKGWKERASDVGVVDELAGLYAAYEAKFGKKPHHKMKADSIMRALQDDEAGAGEPNTDAAGD